MTRSRRMVFVGAGHAHLYALKHCARFVERGHECVLVAPGAFWYSGLATGVLGGQYPSELDRIDVAALVESVGGRFVEDRVRAIDAPGKCLTLASGRTLDYDVVSLNVGSRTPPIEGESEFPAICFAAKPVERLFRLGDELATMARQDPRAPRIVIAGGGPTAFELAANLLGLARRLNREFDITLVAGHGRVLRQLPRRAARNLIASLTRRGLSVVQDQRVVRVSEGGVVTDGGLRLEIDRFVNATGLRPPAVVRRSGLAVDEEGSMVVDEHLRSVSAPSVFGGGDCIRPAVEAIDKVGVYAIREAPILLANTLAAVEGQPPKRSFRPQRKYLWIMNLGDGTGLAARGRLWFRGRAAFVLKDWIDRRFLRSMTPQRPSRGTGSI
jgi:NADH dehydrogenase FAD-containing subunit